MFVCFIANPFFLRLIDKKTGKEEDSEQKNKFSNSDILVAPSMWVRFRDDICRDRWDQQSRKIFVDCVNFSVNNANCEQNLPNPHILRKHLCHFYAKCANIGQIYTYCVNICATFTQSV